MSEVGEIDLGRLSSPQAHWLTLLAERGAYATFCEYLRAVDDHMQCARAGACFTQDAEITYQMKEQPMLFHGREAFIGYLEGAKLVHEMSVHVVGQHRFSWIEGRPRISAYISAWHWFLDRAHLGSDRAADFMTIGYAEDEFTFIDGKWLISRRLVRPAAGLVGIGAMPPGNITDADAT